MYKGFPEISNKWANMKITVKLLNSITKPQANYSGADSPTIAAASTLNAIYKEQGIFETGRLTENAAFLIFP